MPDNLIEDQLESDLTKSLEGLSEETKLSKVLFPDTHTTSVTILGKKRVLKPVPLKVSQQLRTALVELTDRLQAAFAETKTVKPVDDDMVTGMKTACLIISEYYGWADIIEALEQDNLTVSELQSIVALQSQLNGANDFLLTGLRVAVRVMQLGELWNHRFHSMLTMPQSSNIGTVASTN